MRRRWSGCGFFLTAVVSFLVIAEAHEDLDERIRQGILPLCPHADFVNAQDLCRFIASGSLTFCLLGRFSTAAVKVPDHELLKKLVADGGNANGLMDDGSGRTLLHEAARLGHATIISVLLEAGADVDAPDSNGRTPLMESAWEGHADATRALLAGGADTELENLGGGTALKVAMRRKHKGGGPKTAEALAVIQMLSEHRATNDKVTEHERERYKVNVHAGLRHAFSATDGVLTYFRVNVRRTTSGTGTQNGSGRTTGRGKTRPSCRSVH